jgi:pyruvate dehydrogenase E1 component beta subunit
MTDGQVRLPLVIHTANGAGLRFGAQHSQSVESWLMAIPGLKVIAPSTPADVVGLMVAAIRDDDPVIVCASKSLLPTKGEVPDGEHVLPLGQAAVAREGSDCTLVALGSMVPRAVDAAERLQADHGIGAEVLDLRTLIPLDAQAVLASVAKTSRLFTVEENPRVLGWGAEIVSLVADEGFWSLDAPIVRITTPQIPLPSAAALEDAAIPSVDRIVATVRTTLEASR